MEDDTAAVTGEPRVDAALSALDRLDALEVSEHPAVFVEVHTLLTAALAAVDEG